MIKQPTDVFASSTPDLNSCKALAGGWQEQQECWQQLVQRYAAELEMTRQQLQMAETALEESEAKNQALAEAATVQAQQFSEALKRLQQTQTQLIQTEKMSSLGQLVAGVAHEINNPVNFICGNLFHISTYVQDLLMLVQYYRQQYPDPAPDLQALIETIDLEFLSDDLLNLLSSMDIGVERIQKIVLSLRNFSRLDEAEIKPVDIHEGIDNTLMILNHRLKKQIEVIKHYGNLPLVECYPAQLNQVFMNILSNAIDALEESSQFSVLSSKLAEDTTQNSKLKTQNPPMIRIQTEVIGDHHVCIRIADSGPGISESIQAKLFDPFFTTKPVGQGTGLGLSICYQILEKHRGQIEVNSVPGEGAEFIISIPLVQEFG